jgi:hypothetical protein
VADDVAVQAGSGTTLRTDDVGGAQVAYWKLMNGASGSDVPVPADSKGLAVSTHRTTRTTAGDHYAYVGGTYTAGRQVGDRVINCAGAAAVAGRNAIIRKIVCRDRNGACLDLYAWVFTATVTNSTNNGVLALTPADMANFAGRVKLDHHPTGGADHHQWTGDLPVYLGGTSVYVVLQTMTGGWSTSDYVWVHVTVERDDG